MKHLLRNMIGIFAVTLFVLLFYACEQDPQIKKYEYPMPEVSGMSPNIGYVSSQVVITGTNFGDRTEPVKVFFGSVLATKVLMCKNNRIVVEVPDGAASGDVTMQIWTNDVGVIGQYKVLPTPYVHSVVSDNPLGTGVAEEDDVVTITGENFGTDVNDIEVSFNGTSAKEIRLVDESTIEAVTPRNWVSGNVVITIRGYAMTGNALFNPNAKGDVTSVYLKNYKQPFAKASEESWKNGEWWTPACFLIIPSFFSLSDDSLFLPTLQATACGVFGYLQLLGFFQEGLIGELRIQGDEETFLVGHAPVLHLVGGKEREYVYGV